MKSFGAIRSIQISRAMARMLKGQIQQMRLAVETADESLLRNEERARRNRSMIPAMRFAAQRFDHLGRRMQVVEKLSQEYWDAYLNLGDRRKVGRLRNYWGNIYNSLREMAEELTILRESYRRQWLAENRPYWLDSVLARYDQAIAIWLNKSKALAEAGGCTTQVQSCPTRKSLDWDHGPCRRRRRRRRAEEEKHFPYVISHFSFVI